jgi:flagellar motility protein MotE (MotC chaperone)
VIVVGFALLGLKGEGLVRAAWAQEQTASSSTDVLAKDTAPLASDPAADDTKTESAGAVDVLSSLAKRRAVLDAHEADLDMRSQVLSAAEARVDSKIATLKQLQDQIQSLLGQRDDAQKTQLASLVKTYSAMKAKDAARIFNSLSDDVLVPVAQAMKSDVLAPILANMTADNAQKLTVKLASRLNVPQTAAAALPQPAAPTPAAALAPAATTAPVAPPEAAPAAAVAPQPAKPAPRKPKPRTASAKTRAPASTPQATTPPPTAPQASTAVPASAPQTDAKAAK